MNSIISETYKKRIQKLSGISPNVISVVPIEVPSPIIFTHDVSEDFDFSKDSLIVTSDDIVSTHATLGKTSRPMQPMGIGINEISQEEVKIPNKFIHDNLNQEIWDGEELRPEIHKKMLEIAKEFYKHLDVDAKIKDIKLIGSMANYNWTSKSDIDIHLFFDFSEINEDVELVKKYLDAKKLTWANSHDIRIKDIEVELYSQGIDEKNASVGVYNLSKNEWEVKPEKENFKIDRKVLKRKIISIINEIEKLERSKKNIETIYEGGTRLKDKIKKMRKAGLEDKGEFSIENLSFKYLRNNGYIEKLFGLTIDAFDKSLSLD